MTVAGFPTPHVLLPTSYSPFATPPSPFAHPRRLRPGLLADLDRHGPLLAVAVHRPVHGLARRDVGDLARQVARLLDGLAVDRHDGVARAEARLVGRAILEGFRNERAARLLEADRLGDLPRDRLHLHADEAAGDRAVLLERGHDLLHGRRRDREG